MVPWVHTLIFFRGNGSVTSGDIIVAIRDYFQWLEWLRHFNRDYGGVTNSGIRAAIGDYLCG